MIGRKKGYNTVDRSSIDHGVWELLSLPTKRRVNHTPLQIENQILKSTTLTVYIQNTSSTH